ncbi:MAG: hypothetical protein ACI8O8_000092 [Oleiphilaceae bacterium]|jgi:hypothetical protein
MAVYRLIHITQKNYELYVYNQITLRALLFHGRIKLGLGHDSNSGLRIC